jgi:prophage regulatory protein
MSETNVDSGAHPIRFLRIAAVMDRTGLAESTIYQHMAQGKFPRSFRIGARQAVWDERDIIAWQEARLTERDKAAA